MIQAKTSQLNILLASIVGLNTFDLLSTMNWCTVYGWDQELNPLIRYFFAISPLTGVTFKLLIVLSFITLISYASRLNFRLAYLGTIFVVLVYTALAWWHILGPILNN